MHRVPEQAVVVSGLVLIGVIDVDIDHMRGQLVHRVPPAPVARAHELNSETGQRIVLIVVVRHEGASGACQRPGIRFPFPGLGTGVMTDPARLFDIHRLMIGIDVAEIPPAVLINHFSLLFKRIVPFDSCSNELDVVGVGIFRFRREIRNGAAGRIPGRIESKPQRRADPFQRLVRRDRVLAEGNDKLMRLLLAALELVQVGILSGKQP